MLLMLSDMSSCPASTQCVSNIVCHTSVKHGTHVSYPNKKSWQLRLPVHVHAPLMMHAARELLNQFADQQNNIRPQPALQQLLPSAVVTLCNQQCSTEEVLYASVEMLFCDLLHATFTNCMAIMLQKTAAFGMLTHHTALDFWRLH